MGISLKCEGDFQISWGHLAVNEVLEKVKARKNFYRDYYRRACTALWFSLFVIAALSLIVMYLVISQPTPDFYATSSDGKLVMLTPMESPNYSSTPLIK